MNHKACIILEQLLDGEEIEIHGRKYVMCDENELCVPVKDQNNVIHYMKTFIALKDFIALVNRYVTDDDISLIHANSVLNNSRL